MTYLPTEQQSLLNYKFVCAQILFVLFLNCHVTIFVDHAIILGQLHKRQEAIKVNRTIEFPQSLSYNNNRTNGIKKVLLLNKDQIELLWSTDHWSRKVMKSKVKSLRSHQLNFV